MEAMMTPWEKVRTDVESRLKDEFVDQPVTIDAIRRMTDRAHVLLKEQGWGGLTIAFDEEYLRMGEIRIGKVSG